MVITTLLRGCINLFDLLISRNIKIEKVMADASTVHGEKICSKLLKMNYITDTSHDSKIYCEDGKDFIKAIEKLEKIVIYSYSLSEEIKPWNNRFMNLNYDIEEEQKGNAIWEKNNMYLKKVDISEFKNVIYPEYKKIFPSIERKPYTEIEKAYNNNLTDIIKIIVEDQFVGFFIINYLNDNPYVVLDYFAILPKYKRR